MTATIATETAMSFHASRLIGQRPAACPVTLTEPPKSGALAHLATESLRTTKCVTSLTLSPGELTIS